MKTKTERQLAIALAALRKIKRIRTRHDEEHQIASGALRRIENVRNDQPMRELTDGELNVAAMSCKGGYFDILRAVIAAHEKANGRGGAT